MFGKSKSKPQTSIDSLIGSATRIEGNVIFSGGLRVDGTIRGNVSTPPENPGTVVVSEKARIDGEVHAAHIVVNGSINGPVHSTETLELQASSRVNGDVHYKTIEVVQGAIVDGRLVHHGDDVKDTQRKELKFASARGVSRVDHMGSGTG